MGTEHGEGAMGVFTLVTIALLPTVVVGDVYMHALRGSNNRNCRNDNNDERRNANRLFDSQNNDDGGYSCPRAYPFTAQDNGKCNGNCQAQVDAYGNFVNGGQATNAQNGQSVLATQTNTFYVYGGSKVNIEWTNQHGAGLNENMHADVVLQYMTNDQSVFGQAMASGNQYLRDGTPITSNSGNNDDDEATGRIPNNDAATTDGRYGYQETRASYTTCET